MRRSAAVNRIVTGLAFAASVGSAASAGAAPAATEVYRPHQESAIAGTPFTRYFTTDRFRREITFYMSDAAGQPGPLPLIVYIQGSGGNSNFMKRDGKFVTQNGHSTLYGASRGRARTVMIEKPGVKFLDPTAKPGEPPGSREFCQEQTLERWTEAVMAAIRAARQLPGIRTDRLLVMGHSEGGLVASRVARELGPVVTHVGTLAGGGPTQLYDLISLVRKGRLMAHTSDDPEERVRVFLALWDDVLADSMSAEKLFLGHPNRRWFTFLRSSPARELASVDARIYIAQGMEDAAVDPESADMLYAELLALGKDVTYDRIPGAGHSFAVKDRPSENGWQMLLERVARWYLTDASTMGVAK